MENLQSTSTLFKAAEIELVYKTTVKPNERTKITQSQEAYQVLSKSWNENNLQFIEEFKILLLNNACQVLGCYHHSKGGITSTPVDIRLIFAAAIKANATSIILAHNHPSGNLTASHEDKKLTARVKQAGDILDIRVLDHIIMTSEGYYSFTDSGEM